MKSSAFCLSKHSAEQETLRRMECLREEMEEERWGKEEGGERERGQEGGDSSVSMAWPPLHRWLESQCLSWTWHLSVWIPGKKDIMLYIQLHRH